MDKYGDAQASQLPVDVLLGMYTVFQNIELAANEHLKNWWFKFLINGFLINGLVFSSPLSSFSSPVESKTHEVLVQYMVLNLDPYFHLWLDMLPSENLIL